MSLCKTRARKASWNRVEFYGPEIDIYVMYNQKIHCIMMARACFYTVTRHNWFGALENLHCVLFDKRIYIFKTCSVEENFSNILFISLISYLS